MIAKAQGKFLRFSASKARLVIDLIRGKDVEVALGILMQLPKGTVPLIKKILNSAISNAKQKGLREDQLFISKITADGGPMWKRFRAAGFGRATPLLKKTAHITVELDLKTK